MSAYRRVVANRDVLLIEGTGHAGVGSVIGLSNADVAKMLPVTYAVVMVFAFIGLSTMYLDIVAPIGS